jgi:glycolate oxidase iron-sulfur subunit
MMPGPGIDLDLLADCIHCGLCLETCPTFLETGAEAESPRGRILLAGGIATGRWGPTPDVLGPLDRCLGCRACETACPSGVQYGRILEETRAATRPERGRSRSRLESFLIRHLLGRPRLLHRGMRLYRALGVGRWGPALGRGGFLPAPWREILKLLPVPEPEPEAQTVPVGIPDAAPGPPVTLLRGCIAPVLFPATEAALCRLLRAAGYTVEIRTDPACCGALAAHLGETEIADRFHRALDGPPGSGHLVATAAGCGAHLAGLTGSGVAERVKDWTTLLLEAPVSLRFQADPVTVVYQDACHLKHAQGIHEEPRELLRRSGARLVETPEADLCCGSAGTYNLAVPGMAARLGERKARVLARSGARTVLTANPGCAIQIAAHGRDHGLTVHTLAGFLADRLAPEA